jgi:hypothetical protein
MSRVRHSSRDIATGAGQAQTPQPRLSCRVMRDAVLLLRDAALCCGTLRLCCTCLQQLIAVVGWQGPICRTCI